MPNPSLPKRSIRIARHSTSISLEPEFWDELKRLASAEGCSLNALVARIDSARGEGAPNLSSALRLFVLREIKKGR